MWVGLGFRGKLVKMIKDAGSKYDDYSMLPKIRQILLHWGYELTEIDFFWLDKLIYKNELLLVQQKRNLAKSNGKIL